MKTFVKTSHIYNSTLNAKPCKIIKSSTGVDMGRYTGVDTGGGVDMGGIQKKSFQDRAIYTIYRSDGRGLLAAVVRMVKIHTQTLISNFAIQNVLRKKMCYPNHKSGKKENSFSCFQILFTFHLHLNPLTSCIHGN